MPVVMSSAVTPGNHSRPWPFLIPVTPLANPPPALYQQHQEPLRVSLASFKDTKVAHEYPKTNPSLARQRPSRPRASSRNSARRASRWMDN